LDDINRLGFDIRQFGKNTLIVNGIPEYVKFSDLIPVLEQMLENYKSLQEAPGIGIQEKIAGSMAKASSIPYGKVLEMEEMRELVDKLFACSNPRYSPSGKPVLGIIESDEMDKLLK
jgi:DNA mismatch repair protein MutL